jgi:hypothetical protein
MIEAYWTMIALCAVTLSYNYVVWSGWAYLARLDCPLPRTRHSYPPSLSHQRGVLRLSDVEREETTPRTGQMTEGV